MGPAVLAGLIVGLEALAISAVLLKSRLSITFIALSAALMAGLAVKEYLTAREVEENIQRINSGFSSDE